MAHVVVNIWDSVDGIRIWVHRPGHEYLVSIILGAQHVEERTDRELYEYVVLWLARELGGCVCP